MSLSYHKNLDGIRAIAILMVIGFHFFIKVGNYSQTLMTIQHISTFGQTGVTLFFVLSGFLITRILIDTKKNSNYFRSFYIRRVLRIAPLYYFFLVLFFYVVPWILGTSVPPFREQLFYYTYLQNIAITFRWAIGEPSHFWSLAVEEHFYLFWPLVIYFFSTKNVVRIIGFLILGALILRIYMIAQNYEVFYFTLTRIDALAVGALLAILELKKIFNKENVSKFLVSTLLIVLFSIFFWTIYTGKSNAVIQVLKYVLVFLAYFFLIAWVLSLNKGSRVNRLLESSFFVYTGKISYGLYVYHPLAYFLARVFLFTNCWWGDFLLGLIFTYFLATLSFYLLELRFLRLKKYIETPKNQLQTSVEK